MTGFPDKEVIAELTAKMLLEVDAVRFMTDKPFIYTSGWASPVYTDCRRLISFPRVRQTLIDFGVTTVMRDVGFEQFDAVAGGETAGIPFAAWMADRLTPHPWACFEQPLELRDEAGYAEIPQYHIVCTPTLASRDPGLIAEARAAGRLWDIDTGHDLMITEPQRVADALAAVAAA